MENKKDFDYKFEILSDENTQFEDIVSDSSKLGDTGTVSLSSFSGKHHYPKKPHGFFGKIAEWWKRRKTWQKSVMITAASLLLVFAIAFGVLRAVFDYNYNNITNNPDDLGFEGVLNENVINIALFGIDTRNSNSFKGNSDSIMILSLDKDAKKVRIVSIMRDTFVPMDNKGKSGYGKINSAYAKGGPELAIKTINKIFGLDISEYATVNFYGMADIIEAVGGIDAELTSREVAPSDGTLHSINGCIDEICANLGKDSSKYHIFTPGKHHLNGIQAVAYSRIRYVPNIWGTNNDYGRTDRQRHVMEQLFNKAITLDKTQYVKLAKSLIPCSETSLSYGQIMSLATDILLHSPTFEQSRIPQQEFLMPSPSGYGSVVYYDLDFAKDLMHAFIYEDISFDDYVAQNGIRKNDWYSKIR
jgi:LCP family protein required for cell wall assembly